MSFVQIEAVRAIKLYNKTYRSANQAAVAYANSATSQFTYVNRDRIKHMTGPERYEWMNNIRTKFVRRSLPIFTRYFQES